MVELRATKRRKLSSYHQNGKMTSGGDKATRGIEHNVHALSSSPSPDVTIKKDDASSPNGVTNDIPTWQVRRKIPTQRYSSRQKRTETVGDDGGSGDKDITAFSQNNTRTSERQRRAPRRFGNIEIEKSRASELHTTSSVTKNHTSKNTRKSRGGPKTDVIVGENLTVPKNTPGRRSKKGTARTAVVEDQASRGSSEENKTVDEDSDGLETAEDPDIDYDDSVQLQHDLSLRDTDKSTEQITTPVVLPEYADEFQKLCGSSYRGKVRTLSKIVLEKLAGKRLVPVKELQSEYQKIYQLVEHTIVSGEGNSMLVLGSRGSGKTTMVESALSSLSRQHKDDFHTVRLSGFLHTDDRLALREIWRQLGRETNTEDEAMKINSYADTMATLLALLSHPEDIFGPSEDCDTIATARAVVIVLDEFELFASHSRQTLLYNLFDIAQARKAPLAVIGLTTKVDVTELLEKRVKSRFSHRYVFLPLPRTFELQSLQDLLGLSVEDVVSNELDFSRDEESSLLQSEEGRMLIEGWNAYVKVPLSHPSLSYGRLLTADIRAYSSTSNSNPIYSLSTIRRSLLRISSLVHYIHFPLYTTVPTKD
jgi:origin recognition complex subunit 4